MKNIVQFEIEHSGPIVIKHNGIEMTGPEVECVHGKNTFTIEGSEFSVTAISMFDMGYKELVGLGVYDNNKWTLEYEYPVFTWLHKQLNHGWLLNKDINE